MEERRELICTRKISVVTGIPSGRNSHVRIEREPRLRGWQLNLEVVRKGK